MKKIYFVFFFLSASIFNNVKAQYVFHTCNSRPAYGDSLIGTLNQYDSTGIFPGSSGSNVTWNYNFISPSYTDVVNHYYLDPSTTIGGAYKFPNANLADKVGSSYVYSYYYYSSDSVSYFGDFRDSSGYDCAWDPRVESICPLALGGNFTEKYNRYNFGVCPILRDYSTRTISYDAAGTIILPQHSYPAFRLKIVERTLDSSLGCVGGMVVKYYLDSTYLWIDTISRLPVFSIHYFVDTAIQFADTYIQEYSYSHLPKNVATGIPSPEQEPEFAIYPNPTSGAFQLQVNSHQPAIVSIYNVMGEKVYEQMLSEQRLANNTNNSTGLSSIPLNLTEAKNGIYFLQLKSGQGIAVKKIVKD